MKLILIIICSFVVSITSYALCVNNQSDTKVKVQVGYEGCWKKNFKQNENKCYNVHQCPSSFYPVEVFQEKNLICGPQATFFNQLTLIITGSQGNYSCQWKSQQLNNQ